MKLLHGSHRSLSLRQWLWDHLKSPSPAHMFSEIAAYLLTPLSPWIFRMLLHDELHEGPFAVGQKYRQKPSGPNLPRPQASFSSCRVLQQLILASEHKYIFQLASSGWFPVTTRGKTEAGEKSLYHTGSLARCSWWSRGVGWGERGRWYVYNYGWFVLSYGRNHHHIVKQFSFN